MKNEKDNWQVSLLLWLITYSSRWYFWAPVMLGLVFLTGSGIPGMIGVALGLAYGMGVTSGIGMAFDWKTKEKEKK